MCEDEALRDIIPGEALSIFRRLIGKDIGAACDFLMRHYRGEYWPRRLGAMPSLRRVRSDYVIKLPNPKPIMMTVSRAIVSRRSAEDFIDEPVSIDDLSTILYLGLGITGWTQAYGLDRYPLRAYPSAGALQPIEAYPVIHNVTGLREGLYHYDPFSHALEVLKLGKFNSLMADLASGRITLAGRR
ncbi:SagB/ThcOx family dehydrogenase [Vulcanisaeta sp. JCM 16161]|uniref:SagB/ThcOx family dehydrogenase n=1 Tax=Vulcanisaeta sp. JCM 16161 TaxID=1295372 RepID=UPI000A440FC5|nr:SagB/ThcOx family dehydrogenase [Vulcanisaeta sp. JCM 16161]